VHFPAPVGGLDTLSPASQIPLTHCLRAYNLISSDAGLRARLGSQEWVTGLTGASDNTVRTIIPFMGSDGSGQNRLFATTSSGIWDVTSQGAPTTVWAGATAYTVGAHVTSNSNTYACKTAGTSAASGGLPATWAATTAYVIGDRVRNSNNVYICTTGGTSAGADGPSGTGTGITDGTVVWDYQSAETSVSDGTVTWRYVSNNTAPVLELAFATTTGRAGWGVCTTLVTTAGHFLVYCDEVNGAYLYTESSDTWVKYTSGAGAGQINGVDPANLVACTVFKQRLWFVQRDSAKAWYLDTAAVSGAATSFNLGSKFRQGGDLRGLWNWTGDGGAGIDDRLVAISGGGDVVIYEGTDPTDSLLFGLKGVWSVGQVPKGRRFATSHGGDVLIITRGGPVAVSDLVSGSNQYSTAPIANLFNRLPSSRYSLDGWSARIHPEDNALIVTIPTYDGSETEQAAMSLSSKAWTEYRDLDLLSCDAFDGTLYYGTPDGKVCKNSGYVDGVTLADPSAYTAIQWRLLTGFHNFGNANQKQVQIIRPTVLCDGGNPAFTAEARYRYSLAEVDSVSPGAFGSSAWDSGVWDSAVWGGEYSATQQVGGAVGIGSEFAIAIRGTATSRTVLVGLDAAYKQGGLL